MVKRGKAVSVNFLHYQPQARGTPPNNHAGHGHHSHDQIVRYDMCPTPRLKELRLFAPRIPEFVAIEPSVSEGPLIDISGYVTAVGMW